MTNAVEIAAAPATYPCGACGADLAYVPGTAALECSHCGHTTPIAGSEDRVEERDFYGVLESLESAAGVDVQPALDCPSCGARIERDSHTTALPCPFCDTAMVDAGEVMGVLPPESLLPFAIDGDGARAGVRRWIRRLWLAPNELKRFARLDDRLQGVYVPHWTYDARTTTDYRGMRGDDYYVTKTRTVTRDGKRVEETYRERKTRWSPANGTVADAFDDVLIPASRSLPEDVLSELEPWDLGALEPYDAAYLSGFRAERYQVDLDEGFGRARAVMKAVIRGHVKRDIGGDHQQISDMDTRYEDVTFKHLLLPVWVGAYRYREKLYRVAVNARTGEVLGERPWSWVKITAAALAVAALLAVLIAYMQ